MCVGKLFTRASFVLRDGDDGRAESRDLPAILPT